MSERATSNNFPLYSINSVTLSMLTVVLSPSLNALLPADVRVRKATEVATDFHARYSAVSKQYHYRMLLGAEGDVFRRKYTYHIPTDLNIAAMKEAALHIVGEHDFSAFCASNTSVVDKVRTVT